MQAWNFTVELSNRPGELARVAEAFGKAGLNIEGFYTHPTKGDTTLSLLAMDEKGARKVFETLNLRITDAREVLVDAMPNRPGTLGEQIRHLADEGINLTVAYVAGDNRIVLGADDLPTLRKVWEKRPAAARS